MRNVLCLGFAECLSVCMHAHTCALSRWSVYYTNFKDMSFQRLRFADPLLRHRTLRNDASGSWLLSQTQVSLFCSVKQNLRALSGHLRFSPAGRPSLTHSPGFLPIQEGLTFTGYLSCARHCLRPLEIFHLAFQPLDVTGLIFVDNRGSSKKFSGLSKRLVGTNQGWDSNSQQ